MTYLSYNGELWTGNDQEAILNLTRKGWAETPPPEYNPATHRPPRWSEGEWVTEALTLPELFAVKRVQMAAIIEGLTVAQRARFEDVRGQVASALDRGDIAVAREIIEMTDVAPELESAKAEILALFPTPES